MTDTEAQPPTPDPSAAQPTQAPIAAPVSELPDAPLIIDSMRSDPQAAVRVIPTDPTRGASGQAAYAVLDYIGALIAHAGAWRDRALAAEAAQQEPREADALVALRRRLTFDIGFAGDGEGSNATRAYVEYQRQLDAFDALVAEVRSLREQLAKPCGSCHPCENWADETWRRAGKKPPAVVTWENTLAELASLRGTGE